MCSKRGIECPQDDVVQPEDAAGYRLRGRIKIGTFLSPLGDPDIHHIPIGGIVGYVRCRQVLASRLSGNFSEELSTTLTTTPDVFQDNIFHLSSLTDKRKIT